MMRCPHCGIEIPEEMINKYTTSRAGKATSRAKAVAAKRNIEKRWAKQRAKDARKVKGDTDGKVERES